jgi:glycine cleavage system H lipoate-binding protein
MVMTLVVLTFVVFVLLDHFVFSKQPETARALSPIVPLPAVAGQVPAGVFLQPTFTWSRLGGSGEVYVGVHPMLLGLVGEACALELRAPGERVGKGESLVGLSLAGRHLTVRSPLAGRVDAVNSRVSRGALWRGLEGDDGGWLYRIQSERVADEVPHWFAGEQAAEWARRRYDELRAYLHDAMTGGHLGTVMADGGELPVGILGDMDASVWAGLEDRFLSHAE